MDYYHLYVVRLPGGSVLFRSIYFKIAWRALWRLSRTTGRCYLLRREVYEGGNGICYSRSYKSLSTFANYYGMMNIPLRKSAFSDTSKIGLRKKSVVYQPVSGDMFL